VPQPQPPRAQQQPARPQPQQLPPPQTLIR
jgi:hypothetical protein